MKEQIFNPNIVFGQVQIASLLSISDRQVRNLQNQGVLPKSKGRNGLNPHECIRAYIAYKAVDKPEETEPETLTEESEKKREQQLKNDEREERILLNRTKRLVLEKQYAPIAIITDTISQVSISLRTRVDSWLPKLKMASPDMQPEQVEVLKRELAMLLNELADVKPDLSIYEDSDIESGLASFDSIESDDTADRS
jgi:phage terminase Nu1 subunit (DNA packaging protein)